MENNKTEFQSCYSRDETSVIICHIIGHNHAINLGNNGDKEYKRGSNGNAVTILLIDYTGTTFPAVECHLHQHGYFLMCPSPREPNEW